MIGAASNNHLLTTPTMCMCLFVHQVLHKGRAGWILWLSRYHTLHIMSVAWLWLRQSWNIEIAVVLFFSAIQPVRGTGPTWTQSAVAISAAAALWSYACCAGHHWTDAPDCHPQLLHWQKWYYVGPRLCVHLVKSIGIVLASISAALFKAQDLVLGRNPPPIQGVHEQQRKCIHKVMHHTPCGDNETQMSRDGALMSTLVPRHRCLPLLWHWPRTACEPPPWPLQSPRLIAKTAPHIHVGAANFYASLNILKQPKCLEPALSWSLSMPIKELCQCLHHEDSWDPLKNLSQHAAG